MTETNRRQTSRFKSQNEVKIHKDLDLEGEMTLEQFEASGAQVVVTLDMSQGGCLLFTPEQIAVGTPLTFAIRCDDHIVTVKGKSVRASRTKHEGQPGWKIGVQFDPMEPMVRDGIELYLVESGADPTDDPTAK